MPHRSRTSAGVDVVPLAGDLDLGCAEALCVLGATVLDQPGIRILVLDLAAVTFVDSTGIAALMQIRRMAEERDVSLELGNVSSNFARVLHIAGLSEFFGVNPGPPGAG